MQPPATDPRSAAAAYDRGLIEASLDPLVTIGLDGKITDVNAATERATGLPRRQLVGTNFSEYFTDPEKARAGYERVFREGFVRDYDLQIRHQDGRVTPVLYNATVYRDDTGEIAGVFAAARDITERLRMEETVRRANAYNRGLIEASVDPLVTISPEGKVTDVNTATERVTGRSRDELIGTDFSRYFTDPSRAEEGYQRVFRDGFVTDYALEVRHRDGRVTPVLYNATVYRDQGGQIAGVFAAARDVTELQKAQRSLEEKAQELARSNAELEQFAYVASHDLQEPLRTVTSFVQLLAKRNQGRLGPEADEFIGFIIEAASRMQTMINDLLAYSRIERKGHEFVPVDSGDLVQQALDNLRLAVAESRATITRDPMPEVVADATQLLQVFQNLLSNAIKFRSSAPLTIHIGARREPDAWVFSVRDNGIGIDPKYFDRLFVIFQRLHTKAEYPGTGIGLALCKRIVERHGGRIWVESQPGQGSAFNFSLPVRGES